MIVFALIVSLPVGMLLGEIIFRALTHARISAQFREIGDLLQDFHKADGDEIRQALLLRAGFRTLQISFKALALIFVLAAIAFLPPWLLNSTESQQIVYFVAVSVFSTCWWIWRRSRGQALGD